MATLKKHPEVEKRIALFNQFLANRPVKTKVVPPKRYYPALSEKIENRMRVATVRGTLRSIFSLNAVEVKTAIMDEFNKIQTPLELELDYPTVGYIQRMPPPPAISYGTITTNGTNGRQPKVPTPGQ